MKNRLYQIIFKEIRPFLFFFFFFVTSYIIRFIVDKSKNCFALVDNRRRLILNRLNKFANIERYWKIIGKARWKISLFGMMHENGDR